LIRYGLLAAGALVCAALAALGEFQASPLLAGQVKRACLVAVAVAMAIQGAVLFPRSWPSRIIVKPHALAAGSLILFAGAALLLVLALAGCNPTATTLVVGQINFYGGESTEAWTVFGADGPFFIAAQDPPERTQKSNQTACRRTRSCRLAALGSQSLRAQQPCQRVCAGRK
jgi:hypothetical protein